MRGGQNRLPTAVKEAKGTAQPCRQNPDEPRLAGVQVPAAPEDLAEGRRDVWARLARQVDALGVFTEADCESFAFLVAAVAYAHEIEKTNASPNQIVAARAAAFNALAAFGLTPQSRARVSKVPREQPDDDLAEFDA